MSLVRGYRKQTLERNYLSMSCTSIVGGINTFGIAFDLLFVPDYLLLPNSKDVLSAAVFSALASRT